MSWEKILFKINNNEIFEKLSPERYKKNSKFYPEITYEYIFNNTTYYNNRFALDIDSCTFNDLESAEHFLENILKEKTVYVNPTKGGESYLYICLNKARINHYNTLTISGVILFCIGIFLAYV